MDSKTAAELWANYMKWVTGEHVHGKLFNFFQNHQTTFDIDLFLDKGFWGYYYHREFGNVYGILVRRGYFRSSSEESS